VQTALIPREMSAQRVKKSSITQASLELECNINRKRC